MDGVDIAAAELKDAGADDIDVAAAELEDAGADPDSVNLSDDHGMDDLNHSMGFHSQDEPQPRGAEPHVGSPAGNYQNSSLRLHRISFGDRLKALTSLMLCRRLTLRLFTAAEIYFLYHQAPLGKPSS